MPNVIKAVSNSNLAAFAEALAAKVPLKSDIPTKVSDLSDDATHRVVTDTEKSTWSGKQDALTFDTVPTENSSNPVTSGGLYTVITNNEFVVSSALNDLNTRVLDLEDTTVPTKTSELQNDSGFITTESDPTVPAWAKSATKPTYTAAEVGALPDTTVIPDVSGFFDEVSYDSGTKRINFKQGTTVKKYIDATDFIKDGMIDSVGISTPESGSNAGVSCLVVTFNVDAGKEDIEIPLSSIFNPSNYYTKTEINSGFVAQESGKGLSSEDYTSAEKTKLSGIETGAQVNVKPDWNAASGTSAEILNKPSIPSSLSDLSDDATHRVVTDTEKTTWNAKQDALTFDSAPTENSTNPVTSGGVYSTIAETEEVVSTAINNINNRLLVIENTSIPTKVSDLQNDSGFTTNIGTITGITMNNVSQGTSGVVDLGTVITSHQDITGKADKVSGATSGNFAGLDSNGNLTDSGSKASDFATAAQGTLASTAYQKPSGGIPVSDLASGVIPDVSGKADKVSSPTSGNFAGLDSNGNLTDSGSKAADFATAAQGALASSAYQKPQSGIPASDLASGVIPDISGKANTADLAAVATSGSYNDLTNKPTIPDVSGKENTSNKVTSLSAQSTDTQYPSAKATYDAINPPVQSSQPQGGMLPNVFYNLGLLSANTTFSLATPVDANILNHYYWVFETGSTNITITWPAAITSWIDTPPVISANKHYEVSVLNGVGGYIEV